ncbi:imm11 family protein [Flavobacterium ginsengiterrae]|uniref:Immunity MXAN-0049 protein domain-containing protein n=1 Tax=Flavobacterium ginsengiterrae TaxID=871695 RepID=A0ABP7G7E7_9FLAO
MNIYKIGSDYDNYRFLLPADNTGLTSTDGGSLIKDWKICDYFLFKDPRKKTDKRKTDFTASCYNSSVLMIENRHKDILMNLSRNSIEYLEINTPELNQSFYIANIVKSVNVIEHEAISHEDFMNSFRNGTMKFRLENIGDNEIFRDKKFSSFYYCTQKFIDAMNEANITGLKFTNAGIAF